VVLRLVPIPRAPVAIALWIGAALAFALHVFATFCGSHVLWGFSTLRYLSPTLATTLIALWGLALVPVVARRLEPAVARIAGAWPFWLAVVLVLLCVWNDRLQFLGDWLMRRGSVALDVALKDLYPQALPLDLAFHVNALRPLGEWVGVDRATRIAGGLEVVLLVVAALAFRSRLGLGRRAGLATAAVAITAGYLQLFTGFNKAVCDLCVLTALAMAFAVAAPVSAASLVGLGFVSALATLLHRAGVLLVPAVLVAIVLRWRQPGLRPLARWLPALLALALPVIALAFAGPKIWYLLVSFDWPKHVALPGNPPPWIAAFQPGHVLDLVNALALLTPLGILGCLLAPFVARRERLTECLSIASVAFPLALLLVFVRPQQGVFRDLDVLAPGAVAVGFVAAWAIGRVIERDKSSGGLALAVAATCFACTISWLALLHDSSRGIGWVRGFTTAEAHRPPIERALAWDYLGFQAMHTLRWDEAVVAWRETNRVITTGRTVSQLAIAQTMVGDLDAARANFRRALTIEPGQLLCWRGLATTSYRLGDYAEARRAARELQRRGASPPELADLLRELDRIEAEQASERMAPAPAPSVAPHASARSHVPRASVMPWRSGGLTGPSSQVPERSPPEPASR
jgi:hypothetical protein